MIFTLMLVVLEGFSQPVPGSLLGSRSKYRLKAAQPEMALHLAAHFSESYEARLVNPR